MFCDITPYCKLGSDVETSDSEDAVRKRCEMRIWAAINYLSGQHEGKVRSKAMN